LSLMHCVAFEQGGCPDSSKPGAALPRGGSFLPERSEFTLAFIFESNHGLGM
jgi:hypothetical protein